MDRKYLITLHSHKLIKSHYDLLLQMQHIEYIITHFDFGWVKIQEWSEHIMIEDKLYSSIIAN